MLKKIKNLFNKKKNDDDNIEMEIVKEPKEKKKKITVADIVRYVVMIAALCMFTYASYELTLIYITGEETEELKNEVSDLLTVKIDDSTKEYYNALGEKIELVNSGDGTAFVWDLEKVKEVNPNAKGYIKQGTGTYIDNPIVQHPTDNNYYLYHLSNNYPSGVGSIFIDARISEGLYAKNCILYGHYV